MTTLKCPHCGNEEEFYTKENYKGVFEFFIDKHGKEIDGRSVHSTPSYWLKSNYIFCSDCNKKVCKIRDFKIES